MGARSLYPCRLIARTLAKKGIASFILYLVFHKLRASEVIQKKYPNLSAEEWFESYQVSVTDIRQVIDWSSCRPEIIKDKIALVGISFGGMISTIAMGLDTRIKAGVMIVSGGNSEKITRYSLLLRWQYKHNEEEFRHNQHSYAQYLSEVGEKGFENVKALKTSYLTDPMTFSGIIRDRPVLMLNAFWDEMIPRVATLELWKSFGRPSLTWYPATHASIWLWYPLMGRRIYEFVESALGWNVKLQLSKFK
jgi:esterase/lipase